MEELKVLSLSHKHLPVDLIGGFHIEDSQLDAVLQRIRHHYQIPELMYVSTCNRIELVFTFKSYLCSGLSEALFKELYQGTADTFSAEIRDSIQIHHGLDAMRHIMRVSSSLESMIVGEQEIITQFRKSYERCSAGDHTGDVLRLVAKKTIETAKRCFSQTAISANPVSVAFLGWQQMQAAGLQKDDHVILVGAGQTMQNVSRFMRKAGMTNVLVANRSIEAAQELAGSWQAIALDDLATKPREFRAMVTCTGAADPVVTPSMFNVLTQGKPFDGVVLDLGLPADVDADIPDDHPMTYISLLRLQEISQTNTSRRMDEVNACEKIIHKGVEEYALARQQREVELAMREIPEKIKEIKNTALGQVFAKELEHLDEHSLEVLHRVLDYMEKKYISVPMKMAREVIVDAVQKN